MGSKQVGSRSQGVSSVKVMLAGPVKLCVSAPSLHASFLRWIPIRQGLSFGRYGLSHLSVVIRLLRMNVALTNY